MLRLTGSLLILAGGFLLRRAVLQGRRKQAELLGAFSLALQQLRDEIRFSRLPLPQLFEAQEIHAKPSIRPFFHMVNQCLQNGLPLQRSWQFALLQTQLYKPAFEPLEALGIRFCGDGKAVTDALALTISKLEQLRSQMEQQQTQEEKQITALSLSAAVFLVILLI